MDDNIVMVSSASDMTVVINIPDIPLHRVWKKRGAKYPFERRLLEQIYYNASVEYLFKHGILVTNDKTFLKDVGLMDDDENMSIIELTPALMMRMIKHMPISELKEQLAKLSNTQLAELGEYAVENYKDLNLDRADILSAATHKNLLRAIENNKAAQED